MWRQPSADRMIGLEKEEEAAVTGQRRADGAGRGTRASHPGVVRLDSMPNNEEIFRLFDEHRVPYAPVLTIEQAMAHPHLRERGVVRSINDRFLGEFDVPGFPLRLSKRNIEPALAVEAAESVVPGAIQIVEERGCFRCVGMAIPKQAIEAGASQVILP